MTLFFSSDAIAILAAIPIAGSSMMGKILFVNCEAAYNAYEK